MELDKALRECTITEDKDAPINKYYQLKKKGKTLKSVLDRNFEYIKEIKRLIPLNANCNSKSADKNERGFECNVIK